MNMKRQKVWKLTKVWWSMKGNFLTSQQRYLKEKYGLRNVETSIFILAQSFGHLSLYYVLCVTPTMLLRMNVLELVYEIGSK